MKRQEIFDKVCNHLMTQMAKADGGPEDSDCKYRGAGGKTCAIGCLIPDEKYQERFEGNAPTGIGIGKLITHAAGCNITQVPLLDELQIIHDMRDVEDWKMELRCTADNWNLKQPECIQ